MIFDHDEPSHPSDDGSLSVLKTFSRALLINIGEVLPKRVLVV